MVYYYIRSNLTIFWPNSHMHYSIFVIFCEIFSNYGQIKPRISKLRSNLTNAGLTTNGRLASVALA